jgi:hypothetical protein
MKIPAWLIVSAVLITLKTTGTITMSWFWTIYLAFLPWSLAATIVGVYIFMALIGLLVGARPEIRYGDKVLMKGKTK